LIDSREIPVGPASPVTIRNSESWAGKGSTATRARNPPWRRYWFVVPESRRRRTVLAADTFHCCSGPPVFCHWMAAAPSVVEEPPMAMFLPLWTGVIR
jgi:hypothetical protein